MNYRTKNTRNAILAFIGLTFGFYCFFGFRQLWAALIIGIFVTIGVFFNPNKIQKLKRQEEQDKLKSEKVSPKEIAEEELNNLDLNNIEGFDSDENDKEDA